MKLVMMKKDVIMKLMCRDKIDVIIKLCDYEIDVSLQNRCHDEIDVS